MDDNNKRIVKNTIYLYIRMLVIMALSFFTTRVVLDKLGSADYGINNLVGGFVAMFAVLNSILQSSTNRFIALHLGKGDKELSRVTFSTSFALHLIIALIIVVCLEIGGLWLLNSKLNIDPDRMWAAQWVFHIAVFTVFWQVTQTPFSATVTAHEHFNMYAVMSIYDTITKLLILYLLVVIPFDKLVAYAFLQMAVSFTSVWIYRAYCLKKFEECSLSLKIDKPLAKEMLKFSGWGVFGHLITVINVQGNSILLNIFYNTVMNAARGLAQTVSYTIAQFIAGFLTAAQPQLVKYWGAEDKKRFNRLIFNATQYTLFLDALIGIPVVLEIDYVLGLWLTEVPPYTTQFVQITVICSIIYRSNTLVDQGINAAGYVKQLNLMSTPIYLLSIPLVYMALKCGWGPVVAYWFASIPALLSFFSNLWILSHYTGFPGGKFFLHVFIKNLGLILVSMIIPFAIQTQMEQGAIRFFIVCGLAEICTVAVLYKFGLNDDGRQMVKEKILGKVIKKFRK